MVWKLISITTNLIICFCSSLCLKCSLSSSRAYCIFAQRANSNGFVQLPIIFVTSTIGYFEHPYWVDLGKIQYARDDERPHFCINLNNIDNEVYCDFMERLMSFQTSPLLTTVCPKKKYPYNNRIISIEGTFLGDTLYRVSQKTRKLLK
jgi:hypothetical protein